MHGFHDSQSLSELSKEINYVSICPDKPKYFIGTVFFITPPPI